MCGIHKLLRASGRVYLCLYARADRDGGVLEYVCVGVGRGRPAATTWMLLATLATRGFRGDLVFGVRVGGNGDMLNMRSDCRRVEIVRRRSEHRH